MLSHVIKGLLFLFTLSGAALVFGKADFTNLQGQGFGEVFKALLENGSSSLFGGGVISLFLGYSIMVFTGRTAAKASSELLRSTERKFIAGVPMNPATKRVAGRR